MKKLKKGKILISILFLLVLGTFVIPNFNQTALREANYSPTDTLQSENQLRSSDTLSEFRYGTLSGPVNLDPHYAWDSSSFDVIDQVVETLFACNLSHPEMEIIPRLALDFGIWSVDGLKYRIPLRSGITFHDGTHFDAEAVKWNFDRLTYLLNLEPSFPQDEGSQFYSIYIWPDGSPRIQEVNVISEYIIEFVLSQPYSALDALLSFQGSGIMSPSSTHPFKYIDTLTGDLIGTGPFIYDEYDENNEVHFHAYEDYWQGSPEIDSLTFKIYPNQDVLTQALIDGEVDYIKEPSRMMLQELRDNTEITLLEGGYTKIGRYLVINNQQVPTYMRKAISYALNYDEIISQLVPNSEAVRLRSPVPLGIRYANWEFNVPEFDVITARQALIDSEAYGTLPPADDHDQWIAIGQNNPLEEYTFIYLSGSPFHINLFNILQENLEHIGVRVIGEGISEYWNWLYRISYQRNAQQLFYFGWSADMNDPSNIINTLFSPGGVEYDFNYAQMDDTIALQLMEDALHETDPLARRDFYNAIQQYFVEELYPMCWLYVQNNYAAYNNAFSGFHLNAMKKVWFYSVTELDLTPPEWVNFIERHYVEIGEVYEYYFQAYDESGIDHYVLSSIYPGMEFDPSTGRFSYYADPAEGFLGFSLEVGVFDIYGNYLSNWISVNTKDDSIPYWDVGPNCPNWKSFGKPINLVIEAGNTFIDYICANDNFMVFNFWINNTDDFEILYINSYDEKPREAWLRPKDDQILDIGVYYLEIRAHDGHNYCSETIKITVQDTTSPYWGIQIPAHIQNEKGHYFSQQLLATDYSNIDHYWVDDTDNFRIYISYGNYYVTSYPGKSLEVGQYVIEVRAYDPYGNYCSKTIRIVVRDNTAPYSIDDTIQDYTRISYTRNSQIIGRISIVDYSELAQIRLLKAEGGPAEGFALDVIRYQQDAVRRYINDVIIMTTSSVEIGTHDLRLVVIDTETNYFIKEFRVSVWHQFQIELSGELDYLKDEDISISISALIIDAETGDRIQEGNFDQLVVKFVISNSEGNMVKVGYATYITPGIWRWVDSLTIKEQKTLFTAGIYMVSGHVYVNGISYYYSGCDLMEFHIDPPGESESKSGLPLEIFWFSGFLIAACGLTIYLLRDRRHSLRNIK